MRLALEGWAPGSGGHSHTDPSLGRALPGSLAPSEHELPAASPYLCAGEGRDRGWVTWLLFISAWLGLAFLPSLPQDDQGGPPKLPRAYLQRACGRRADKGAAWCVPGPCCPWWGWASPGSLIPASAGCWFLPRNRGARGCGGFPGPHCRWSRAGAGARVGSPALALGSALGCLGSRVSRALSSWFPDPLVLLSWAPTPHCTLSCRVTVLTNGRRGLLISSRPIRERRRTVATPSPHAHSRPTNRSRSGATHCPLWETKSDVFASF